MARRTGGRYPEQEDIMTIYEIKRAVESAGTAPYFFERKSLKFVGQTMKSFSVQKQDDGRIYISAPMIDRAGRQMGLTERYFDPKTCRLQSAKA